MILWWPEVFVNPDFSYTGEDGQREQAIADGLVGWANCYVEKPPIGFGNGMVKIHQTIGGSATEENLMKLAENLRKDKK